MKADLLSRDQVPVEITGHRILLPWRPAAVWIHHANPLVLLPFRMADARDQETILDAMVADPGAVLGMEREARRILSEATGRKWWEAQKLINTSSHGEALGRLVLAGVDPWNRSIGEWCSALYALYVKGADEKERTKLDFSLAVPPPEAADEWDDDGDDADATLSAVQAMTGR